MNSPLSASPTQVAPTPRTSSGAPARVGGSGYGADEMVSALQTLPHGGLDDTARNLRLPPQIRATISPIVNAFRWGAVLYGMLFGAAAVVETGSNAMVMGLTACLFLTVWRTMLPVRLGSEVPRERFAMVVDTLVFGLAVGYTGASSSPYVFCLVAAIAVAGFGWGYFSGFITISVGWMAMAAGAAVSPERRLALDALFDRDASTILVSMFAVALLAAFGRSRLLDAEDRRRRLAGRIDTLAETNDLLTMLNAVARTLPTSLNQRDALESARSQIAMTFQPSAICLMERDDAHEDWAPKLAEGCAVAPSSGTAGLPGHLIRAIDASDPILVADIAASGVEPIAATSGSGLYTRLVARDRVIGVLGIEHHTPGHYRDRDLRLLAGLADVLALTLDNARWFGRLRSLGAEEERTRIARDLHDRLGQWLTYISFELERINDSAGGSPELEQLHHDVRMALDELRDTLRQLRSEVTDERPLSLVGKELVERFTERSKVETTWTVTHPEERLAVPIENELLRILQESLNNIDKHAAASHVEVGWNVTDGEGVLTVRDDGKGFDASRGVRDTAYGLVGMRERADVVGARLQIASEVGGGTCVTVHAGSFENEREVVS